MLAQSSFQSQATKIISETWDNASLSIYNQSDNSIHELALQNGLMRDISYYIDNKVEEDIPFGAYKPRADSPILSLVSELHVSLNAFQTLKGDKWIDGSVIDAYIMKCDLDWHDICYMPTYYTRCIFGSNDANIPKEFRMYNVHLPISGTILMPYLFSNHWRIFLINCNKNSFTLIDPIRVTKKRSYSFKLEETRVIRNFKKFVSDCPQTCSFDKLRRVDWKGEQWTKRRPFQNDSYNCGAFIVYYMQCIGNNSEMEITFNPANFRRRIAEFLIEQSEDMKKYCIHCFVVNSNLNGDDLVMCTFCRRFAHSSCIPGETKTMAEWASESAQYTCILCKVRPRSWMKYPRQLMRLIE